MLPLGPLGQIGLLMLNQKPCVGLEPTTLRLEVLRAIQLRQQGRQTTFVEV